ncbi:hypothetical protein [Rhizobium johnstonii]|uniref:hypothetical protein n=1 Tax=Rhizobium johnstonii TaxID=3019933 RepID=UPI003F9CBA85
MNAPQDLSPFQLLWVLDDGASFGPDSDLFTTRALMEGGLSDLRVRQQITTLGRIATIGGIACAGCVPVEASSFGADPVSFVGVEDRPILSFDAVFVRVDPPITERFRHALIQLAFEEDRVWFVNSPSAILAKGSKLFNQRFNDRLAPGIISAEIGRLVAELRRSPSVDFVAKPLDLAGGRSVIRLRANDPSAQQRLEMLVQEHGFVHLQRFVDEVETEGEIRHLVFSGSIVAAWRKRPARGDYRANLDQGATVEHLARDYDFSDAEAIVRRVSATAPGFVFYSLDLIGPFINELNVENTGGLPNADMLYGRDHALVIRNLLCTELARRRALQMASDVGGHRLEVAPC